MDCVIRMHKLNLLPDSVLLLESDNPEVARRTLPRATSRMRSGSASSILSRALSRCSPQYGVTPICWCIEAVTMAVQVAHPHSISSGSSDAM